MDDRNKYGQIPNRAIYTGDNLEILRGINSDSVDLIYLDPPFNSNKLWAAPIGSDAAGAAFKDTWTLSDLDEAWLGEVADVHPAVYTVIDAAGLTHGKGMKSYLCMMAVRLLEMHRVLKNTGSVYLHCDATAGHYLKLVMDSIFGRSNFRSEIVWQRAAGAAKGNQYKPVKFGRDSDTIYHYAMSRKSVFHGAFIQPDEDELSKRFPSEDESGRYNTATPLFRPPSMGPRPNLCYEYNGVQNPHPSGWRVSRERLAELDAEGLIIWRSGKRPLRKTYAHTYLGKPMGSMWADIPPVGGSSNERTKYPTQKPIALLERIIKASSNPGDVVLDPFCGCATACVAAENLGRQWAGIDLSELAVELVNKRLKRAMGDLFHDRLVKTPEHPARTDGGQSIMAVEPDAPPSLDRRRASIPRQFKRILFGQQEGRCVGYNCACGNVPMPFAALQGDHIVPFSRGGSDDFDNWQLLCGSCNASKGDKTMEEWKATTPNIPLGG